MTHAGAATAIVRKYIEAGLNVKDIMPLTGGMVNKVEEWLLDKEPFSIVAKLTDTKDHQGFYSEYDILKWLKENTQLPVPEPYACFSDELFNGTCLLMRKINGKNLSEACLTPKGLEFYNMELARHLIDLHGHTRKTYGDVLGGESYGRFYDMFFPAIENEYRSIYDRLDPGKRKIVSDVLDGLDTWLPEFNRPTLVHGDIWSANVIIDDKDPDKPLINAFVDPQARYCEVEQELAYLRISSTTNGTFFREYSKKYGIREGFERRCRIYWLNTWMLHVRYFGMRYMPAVEKTIDEIASLDR